MSTIKLDPSFNRYTRPGRVGGFQPPAPAPKPATGTLRFLCMVVVSALVGASIMYAYFWLRTEF